MNTLNSRIAALLIATWAIGCGNDSPKGGAPATGAAKPATSPTSSNSTPATETPTTPTDTPATDAKPDTKPDAQAADKPFFQGGYNVRATVAGIELCIGEFDAAVSLPTLQDMSFLDAAAGFVDCGLIGKWDLKELLTMLGMGAQPAQPQGATLAADDGDHKYVLAVAELGGVKFAPERPMIIHYLKLIDEGKDQRVGKVNHRVPLKATGPDGAADGTCAVRTLSAGQPTKNQATGKSYTRSVSFENTCEGFEGVDMITYLLIPRFQVDLAFTDEVAALTHIEAQATVKNLASLFGGLDTGGILGLAVSVLGGLFEVEITMDLARGGDIVLADLLGMLGG